MAIVNITADSFSGDGLLGRTPDHIARVVECFLKDGADIIDLGAESTRPGAVPVSFAEEQIRLLPVLEYLIARFPGTEFSVDTLKPRIAEHALDRGASIINHTGQGENDADFFALLAERPEARLVLMDNTASEEHLRHKAGVGYSWDGAPESTEEGDIVDSVAGRLAGRVKRARAAGVGLNALILDPGIGFGKTVEQNLALIHGLMRLRSLGCPLLVGASRKSFIGYVLGTDRENRLGGSLVAALAAAGNGADILRVHDLSETARALSMAEAFARTAL